MSKTVVAAVAAALAVGGISVSDASAADCASVFKFIPNDRLSLQEIISLDRGSKGESGAQADPFLASEATPLSGYPVRGSWSMLAVVYGRSDFTGATPLGGTLWVRDRSAFGPDAGARFRFAKDGIYLTYSPMRPIQGCTGGFTFKLDPGRRIFAGGSLIGRVEDFSGQ